MNNTQILDAIVVKTKRPDLVQKNQDAIQEALSWAHLFDFFRRDLEEVPITYVPQVFKESIDIRAKLPGLRKINYIRKYDPITGIPIGGKQSYLDEVEPDDLLDSYYCVKTNVYYRAGNNINWLSAGGVDGLIVGYWKYPILSPEGVTASWIAQDHPFVLINWAASLIFPSIGQQDESRAHALLATNQMTELLNQEITSKGR